MAKDAHAADSVIIRDLIDQRAAERPDQVAIIFPEDGTQWTFAALREKVRNHAAGFQKLGVKQDDRVICWLPNGPLAVLHLLALNYIGAVSVAINTSYRGGVLAHVLKTADASLMVAHGALIDRLADVDTAALKRIVVVGDERPAIDGIELIDRDALTGKGEDLVDPARPIEPWDTMAVIYTSGTTGPSKGALASYRHLASAAYGFVNVGPCDRTYGALPMFHVGGPYTLLGVLLHGGSTVFGESFKTSQFWSIVREHGVTTTGLLGAMVDFLLSQPPQHNDREHTLKRVNIVPYTEAAVEFGRRFGVDVFTLFNMTEISAPLFSDPNPTAIGSCGKPRGGAELRIVDDHDIEVPVGETGELIVRTDEPWTMSHGYINDPDATARAWRNGWFHTGDLFYRDAEHNYFFVDRKKDAIRRRAENISSFEVEAALIEHPGISEAAVVAAPGAGGEDEVLAVLLPMEGANLDPAQVLEFLRPRLAHFMLPRYVRIVFELPRTPTHKVEKHRLRAEGVTEDTWDRESAGVVVKRDRLEQRT